MGVAGKVVQPFYVTFGKGWSSPDTPRAVNDNQGRGVQRSAGGRRQRGRDSGRFPAGLRDVPLLPLANDDTATMGYVQASGTRRVDVSS